MDMKNIREKAVEWVRDHRVYCRDLVKIVTEEQGIVPLALNDAQVVLSDILDDIESRGIPIRVVVLKARREGVSTYIDSGRFFHRVATRKNTYATIVSHEPASTQTLFEMTKRVYDNLPKELRPATKYNNRTDLIFNNAAGTGLDSAIRVATAGKMDIGSGQLIHLLHLSELSKWPAHTTKSILTSVMQCVPSHVGTEVIVESTAKGIGGQFHKMFKGCRYQYEVYIDENRQNRFRRNVNKDIAEENIWASIFLPWFVFKKYSMAIPPGFEATDEEKELAKTHNLTTNQLVWYRWVLENKCDGSRLIRSQEYPCTPKEAFITSGEPVFDAQLLVKLIDAAKPPSAYYDIQLSTQQFIAKPAGEFQVWKEPTPGSSYIVSADVSEGLEKGDFSCADVVDQLTGQQVAHWHGKTAPDLFAMTLLAIAKRYNTAWIVPERNNHGYTVVTKLFDVGYPKIYQEKVPDPPNKPRKRLGWLTSRSTKPQIIDNLAAELRDNTHGIVCKETLEEMLGYKRDPDGSFSCEENEFDDRVMSYAIAKFVRTKLRLPNMTPTPGGAVGWQPTPTKRPPPNPNGWM